MEHLGKRPAGCFLGGPSGHHFGDLIEIGDVARDVGADYRISDGVKGYLRSFLFQKQRVFRRLARNHAVECPRQGITVKVIFKEIIIGSAVDGVLGDLFITQVTENQNRNIRHGHGQLEKSVNALAIRQEQTQEDRRYYLCFQGFEAVGKLADPFDNKRTLSNASQRLFHCLGNSRITLDKKNTMLHAINPNWVSHSLAHSGCGQPSRESRLQDLYGYICWLTDSLDIISVS